MPCYDAREQPASGPSVSQAEYNALLSKHNRTTNLLCMATQLLHTTNILYQVKCPRELVEWYKQHQEEDKQEAIRVALGKLTETEKELLGLKK